MQVYKQLKKFMIKEHIRQSKLEIGQKIGFNLILYLNLYKDVIKKQSFIDDEDVIEQSLSFIRENGGKIIPKQYQTFINQVLFTQMGIESSKKSISIKTFRIWLKKLGL